MTETFKIPCPKCKLFSEFEVIKSLNDSFPNYVKFICEEKFNQLCCPNCQNYFQLLTTFLFVNNKKSYSLLYIPPALNCEQILVDFKVSIGTILNENHYLSNPFIFDNWDSFKNQILLFERSSVKKTYSSKYKISRQERIDDIDEEAMIMRALRNGNGDLFGF